MAPASDSGYDKKVNDRVPDWFAKLVIGVLATIGTIIAGVSLSWVSSVSSAQAEMAAKQAVSDKEQTNIHKSIDEIKVETRDLRREQSQMIRQLDRISDAVGAKKQ